MKILQRMAAMIFAGLSLGACSSGVMQLGPDLYRASTEGVTVGGSEADVVKTATEHCARMGKDLSVVNMQSNPYSMAAYAGASVNFRCVGRNAGA